MAQKPKSKKANAAGGEVGARAWHEAALGHPGVTSEWGTSGEVPIAEIPRTWN